MAGALWCAHNAAEKLSPQLIAQIEGAYRLSELGARIHARFMALAVQRHGMQGGGVNGGGERAPFQRKRKRKRTSALNKPAVQRASSMLS